MTDGKNQDKDQDLREIVEELEPMESLDELNEDEGLYSEEGGQAEISAKVPIAAAAFANSLFPVLLVDSELRILFANKACHKLFSNFYRLTGNIFTDLFGRALGVEALKDMRKAIHSGERGYSWKGLARSKVRSSGTILTKAYCFPDYINGAENRQPKEFVVLFDDITEENKTLLRSVFLSLLEASKLKDNDTGKHILRVNLFSRRLSEELYDKPGYEEIDKDFIEDIGFLASMHDVGKIGTPDDILNKEGPLSEWEWSIMQEHTKNGAYILSTYPNPMAREIALNHHERWDGTGYPFKLEGPMIPLAARIVSVADVYDALRMKRSYKNAYDHVTAVGKILDWRGTHFDPSLVDIFDRISGELEEIYRKNED